MFVHKQAGGATTGKQRMSKNDEPQQLETFVYLTLCNVCVTQFTL